MNDSDLTIRVLATIRTDMFAKRMILENIRVANYSIVIWDSMLDTKLGYAIKCINNAVNELNEIIDRINELSKE